jgi:hypothetical protein
VLRWINSVAANLSVLFLRRLLNVQEIFCSVCSSELPVYRPTQAVYSFRMDTERRSSVLQNFPSYADDPKVDSGLKAILHCTSRCFP